MMKKEILVIAYKFPPMGGIGTRRWAKFAKYLTRNGYKIHVLTTKHGKEDSVNWQHDIKSNNDIIIHSVNAGYPVWLIGLSKNNLMLFMQRSCNFLLKKTFFHIDIAQRWYKYMIPCAKKIIINNNIKNVIVTSPPLSSSYAATFLKIDLPEINLIQDFRDNWNDDIQYQYPDTLKKFNQKEKLAYMEWFVINHSDAIVNVTQDITNRTKNKFKQYKDKFHTIYNGFDKDDIKNLEHFNENPLGKIKIIYAGELGLGRVQAIKLVMDALLKITNAQLEKIEVNVYTSYNRSKFSKKYNLLFEKNIVNFYDLVPTTDIFNIINKHQYCLSINSPMYPYAFGTKIFDYMLMNKNIIHISNGGELSNILKKEKQISVSYEPNVIFKAIIDILNRKNNLNKKYYENYCINVLTKEFEKLFI